MGVGVDPFVAVAVIGIGAIGIGIIEIEVGSFVEVAIIVIGIGVFDTISMDFCTVIASVVDGFDIISIGDDYLFVPFITVIVSLFVYNNLDLFCSFHSIV